MEINSKSSTIIESNFQVESEVTMGFDPDALAHLTGLLTNLYNDPEGAVFREYVANGIDAHLAAGVNKPVDIYLPTAETPMFRVQDYGIGMSQHDIENIYSMYGASTKRNNNLGIGGFGLGCKSALAISSQFTVSSVKDGILTTAIILVEDGSAPKLKVVSSKETTKGNGTTVSVPVANLYMFNSRAISYIYYLDDRVNVVNFPYACTQSSGESAGEVTSLDFKWGTAKLSNSRSLSLYEVHSELSEIKIIMGGIYYSIDYEDIRNNFDPSINDLYDTSHLLSVEVPIGSLKLSPNREGIQFNKDSINFLKIVFSDILKSLPTKVKELCVDPVLGLNYAEAMEALDTINSNYRVFRQYLPTTITLDNGLIIPTSYQGKHATYIFPAVSGDSTMETFGVASPGNSTGMEGEFKNISESYVYSYSSIEVRPFIGGGILLGFGPKPSIIRRHWNNFYEEASEEIKNSLNKRTNIFGTTSKLEYVYVVSTTKNKYSFDDGKGLPTNSYFKKVKVDDLEKILGIPVFNLDIEDIRSKSLEKSRRDRAENPGGTAERKTRNKMVFHTYSVDTGTISEHTEKEFKSSISEGDTLYFLDLGDFTEVYGRYSNGLSLNGLGDIIHSFYRSSTPDISVVFENDSFNAHLKKIVGDSTVVIAQKSKRFSTIESRVVSSKGVIEKIDLEIIFKSLSSEILASVPDDFDNVSYSIGKNLYDVFGLDNCENIEDDHLKECVEFYVTNRDIAYSNNNDYTVSEYGEVYKSVNNTLNLLSSLDVFSHLNADYPLYKTLYRTYIEDKTLFVDYLNLKYRDNVRNKEVE